MSRHQYEIYSRVSQTSFCGEPVVAWWNLRRRLFGQGMTPFGSLLLSAVLLWWQKNQRIVRLEKWRSHVRNAQQKKKERKKKQWVVVHVLFLKCNANCGASLPRLLSKKIMGKMQLYDLGREYNYVITGMRISSPSHTGSFFLVMWCYIRVLWTASLEHE